MRNYVYLESVNGHILLKKIAANSLACTPYCLSDSLLGAMIMTDEQRLEILDV